jgi:predicted transcriptional regulator
MFAASNEDLLKSVYDQRAVYGGLLGRTFLIKSNEERPPNAFPQSNEEGFARLKDFISEISRLSGEILFTDEARNEYKKWYDDFYRKMKKSNDRSGVLGRLPTSAKKLSVLLAANDLSSQVCLCHVQQSIDECLALIPNYNSFAYAGGESSIAKAGAIILEALAKGAVNKRSLICENWMHFDSETLDKAIAAFESGGLVKMQIVTNDAWYSLTPKGEEIIGRSQGKSTTT